MFDRAGVGAGASLAATGMLAAAAEHEPGDPELLALALESQRMWPAFGRALEAQSGLAIDFRESGTLVVALGRDEVERLRFRHDLHARCGLATRWLGGPEVRAMEPGLRPSVAAGLFCPDDHQVDPRLVMTALRGAFVASGGHLIEHCAVEALDLAGGRVCGVETAAGRCRAATVVLAAGAWTAGSLLPAGLVVPVRPLKGQALALTATADTGTLSHIVWTEQVHMARQGRWPADRRGDGRGARLRCRRHGWRPVCTCWKARGGPFRRSRRWRSRRSGPGSGRVRSTTHRFSARTGIPGLAIATGHHRNGYLLAPVTAAAIEALVADGKMPAVAHAFGLDRFAGRRSPRAGIRAELEYADEAHDQRN